MAKKNAINAEVGKMMTMRRIPAFAVYDVTTQQASIFANLESFLEGSPVFQEKKLDEKKRRTLTKAAYEQVAHFRVSKSGMTDGDPNTLSANLAFVASIDEKTKAVHVDLVRKEKAEETILPHMIRNLASQFQCA